MTLKLLIAEDARDVCAQPRYIQTHWLSGYRFIPPR